MQTILKKEGALLMPIARLRIEREAIMSYDENEVWTRHFGNEQWGSDVCGAKIYKGAHGDTNSKHGWEVDHIIPESEGGTDAYSNLRPLHWKNNRAKGDELDGNWTCAVRA